MKWLTIALSYLVWPFRVVRLVARTVRRFGPSIREIEGKSRIRQAFEQMGLALFHSIPPENYYTYGFYRDARRLEAFSYLFDQEVKALQHVLNRQLESNMLGDKLLFGRFMEQHGLPVADTVGFSREGALVLCEDGIPECDLFVKPLEGFGGKGSILFRYEEGRFRFVIVRSVAAPGRILPPAGFLLKPSEVIRILENDAKRRQIIVQKRLFNHPEIAELSAGGLISARVLTGHASGWSRFIRATLKLPFANAVASNHGLSVPIDNATGELGTATTIGPSPSWYGTQPETGAQIVGRNILFWPDLAEICTRAHDLLPELAFIGWDVALTETGPVLLEGNVGWGAEVLQKPHRRPLLDEAFIEVCLERAGEMKKRGLWQSRRREEASTSELDTVADFRQDNALP